MYLRRETPISRAEGDSNTPEVANVSPTWCRARCARSVYYQRALDDIPRDLATRSGREGAYVKTRTLRKPLLRRTRYRRMRSAAEGEGNLGGRGLPAQNAWYAVGRNYRIRGTLRRRLGLKPPLTHAGVLLSNKPALAMTFWPRELSHGCCSTSCLLGMWLGAVALQNNRSVVCAFSASLSHRSPKCRCRFATSGELANLARRAHSAAWFRQYLAYDDATRFFFLLRAQKQRRRHEPQFL
jgi:hypothetical protein